MNIVKEYWELIEKFIVEWSIYMDTHYRIKMIGIIIGLIGLHFIIRARRKSKRSKTTSTTTTSAPVPSAPSTSTSAREYKGSGTIWILVGLIVLGIAHWGGYNPFPNLSSIEINWWWVAGVVTTLSFIFVAWKFGIKGLPNLVGVNVAYAFLWTVIIGLINLILWHTDVVWWKALWNYKAEETGGRIFFFAIMILFALGISFRVNQKDNKSFRTIGFWLILIASFATYRAAKEPILTALADFWYEGKAPKTRMIVERVPVPANTPYMIDLNRMKSIDDVDIMYRYNGVGEWKRVPPGGRFDGRPSDAVTMEVMAEKGFGVTIEKWIN